MKREGVSIEYNHIERQINKLRSFAKLIKDQFVNDFVREISSVSRGQDRMYERIRECRASLRDEEMHAYMRRLEDADRILVSLEGVVVEYVSILKGLIPSDRRETELQELRNAGRSLLRQLNSCYANE